MGELGGRRLVGQVRALDGLRGVAVLLVVVVHTTNLLAPWLARGWLPGGFLGVDLFFVLSGFLITALLLNEESRLGRIRLPAFWRRRALRLLPALFALLAVHIVYARVTHLDMGPELSKVRYIVTYTQNWRRRLDGGEGFGHLWSLAVEEQFYIVWPIVVALVLGVRRSLSFVTIVMTAAIVAVFVHRALLWRDHELWLWLIMRTDTRADSLLVGALLAQLWTRSVTMPGRCIEPIAWVSAAFLAVCFLTVHDDGAFIYLGGFTLIAIAAGFVILGAVEHDWSGTALLETRWLCTVGLVSYGLYVWHLPVFTVVQRYGDGWTAPGRILVAYVVTAIATIVSWRYIERPFLMWKARFETRRTVIPAIAAGD